MSIGATYPRNEPSVQLFREALQALCNAGGIAVVAAGNAGVDVDDAGYSSTGTYTPGYAAYPASLAGELPQCVIAVANLRSDDVLSTSSNWGANVAIAAPGNWIWSDINSEGSSNKWLAGVLSGTR